MPYQQGHNPNRQSAFDIVTGAFEDVEAKFYEVKYGEMQWRNVIPEASIDSSINPGADTTSYFVHDIRGKGGFRSKHDQGVPTVGQTLDKILVPMEVAGVTAKFDREDARKMQFGYNMNLLTDLSAIMRKACERHVEGTVFYGDADVKILEGWLDHSKVTVANAVNGAGGFSEWSTKTPDEIVADVNTMLTTVWTGSKQVHLPDTLYLPGEQLALLVSTKMSAQADKSIFEFLKTNNLYTAMTGNELEIKNIRYLDQAGVANVDRAVVAQEKDAENFKLPFPLPFELLEPQQQGFDVELFAEYKFGGFHVRYPKSMLYTDGI